MSDTINIVMGTVPHDLTCLCDSKFIIDYLLLVFSKVFETKFRTTISEDIMKVSKAMELFLVKDVNTLCSLVCSSLTKYIVTIPHRLIVVNFDKFLNRIY